MLQGIETSGPDIRVIRCISRSEAEIERLIDLKDINSVAESNTYVESAGMSTSETLFDTDKSADKRLSSPKDSVAESKESMALRWVKSHYKPAQKPGVTFDELVTMYEGKYQTLLVKLRIILTLPPQGDASSSTYTLSD